MGQGFVDRFAPVSGDYATFRPRYPSELFAWLASIVPARSLAWDCATGSGQAAVELAARFDQVIATDASADQIANAEAHPRIDYRVAPAEHTGIASSSVDLVTVAQALHWFDIDAFFGECERVLVPGGVLAVWTYGPLHIATAAVERVLQRYYHEIVGPFWPEERALVDAGYASIAMPWPEIDAPAFEMTANWTLAQMLGYLGTWSATSAYRDEVGFDPREQIEEALARAWRDPEGLREVTWPLTVRACRRI